jgi:hypothetical protein
MTEQEKNAIHDEILMYLIEEFEAILFWEKVGNRLRAKLKGK